MDASTPHPGSWIRRLLTGDRLAVRFVLLWAAGVALNLAAWEVGHALLPRGLLRGALPTAGIGLGGSQVLGVSTRILAYNVLVAGGLIAAANLFRVGWFPLGYLPVLVHWIGFGLFLGTDSFAVLRDRPTAPSLARLVGSVGFLELSAYTLLAASTVGIWLFRQESWLRWRTERVRDLGDAIPGRRELLGIAGALALLVVSAVWEARGLPG